jgi:chaperone BCS1
MDVWVNFTHTTKSQAKRFFEHIFRPRPSASSPNEALSIDAPPENPVRPRRQASAHVMPILEDREIVELAQSFANAIPEGEVSVCSVSYLSPVSVPMHRHFFQVASLEGYLLKNKRRPRECVTEVTTWCGAVQL